ncbi:MAG: MBL fold metallo-hydrolase [Acidobacteriota bacterium]
MRQIQIGEVRVTRVVEIETITNPTFLYREMVPEALAPHGEWLKPHFVDDEGRIIMAVQTFVIESEGARIVVDTCIGNGKERSMPFWNDLDLPFLDDLTEAGFPPDSIDTVLCTHLHIDHVGWNTRQDSGGHWVPTFENARYLFGREEWEAWKSTDDVARRHEHFGDSVLPIVEADLADFVETDHELTSEVSLLSTPGHAPGHVSVRIASGGEEAVITGDLMHHPSQCAEPDWHCSADWDSEQAVRTRRDFLQRYADTPTLILGTHFATPSKGHIVRDGSAWRFVAEP